MFRSYLIRMLLITHVFWGKNCLCNAWGRSLFPSIPLTEDDYETDFKSRPIRSNQQPNLYDPRTFCSEGDSQPPNRVNSSDRVKALRDKMTSLSYDAFIIPSADEHQNEYVAPSDRRREFISGFSGSAGIAVVTANEKVMWTDSRYTLEADIELDCAWKIVTSGRNKDVPAVWLTKALSSGAIVAADVRNFGAEEWQKIEQKLNDSGIHLADSKDSFDEVWIEFGRPNPGNGIPFIHDIKYAGTKWEDKIKTIRSQMTKKKQDLLVISALDEVAWLFNLRGSDIPFNPVFRSYVVLDANETNPIHLFLTNTSAVPKEVKQHLNIDNCTQIGTCVELREYIEIKSFLENITRRSEIKDVSLSKKHPYSKGVSFYIYSAIPEEKRKMVTSPVLLEKARKIGQEGIAMKEAQLKDSVALVEFLAFFEKEIKKGAKWDELSAGARLTEFRSEQKDFRGNSFDPISAFGSNGAIVHYTPTNKSKIEISDKSLYLLDSGGQYLDGTTDVTRTLHYGTPTDFQKEAYTRVLQGSIEVATLIFPWGTKDTYVDIIARRPLYDSGLIYGHGTGHGIGLYLSVHEGPTLLAMGSSEPSLIEPGQFFSDEPGYYKAGEFGIRLENILNVVQHPTFKDQLGNQMMQFKVVTLVPFEPKLIDRNLLEEKQCRFLNQYNEKVRAMVGSRLLEKGSLEAYKWMTEKTEPMNCLDLSSTATPLTGVYYYTLTIAAIIIYASIEQ